ncbi:MAG: hypothetical protein ACTHMM_18415 [Agriterribacter sp.]
MKYLPLLLIAVSVIACPCFCQDWKDILHEKILADANKDGVKYRLKQVVEKSPTRRAYYWELVVSHHVIFDSISLPKKDPNRRLPKRRLPDRYFFGLQEIIIKNRRIVKERWFPEIWWKLRNDGVYTPVQKSTNIPAEYLEWAGQVITADGIFKFYIPKI